MRRLGVRKYFHDSKIFLSHLLLVGFLSLAAQVAVASASTAQEKILQTKWQDIHGINLVPIYAENTYEIWRNYDHAEFDRELGLAAGVGFNSVRLWLNVMRPSTRWGLKCFST